MDVLQKVVETVAVDSQTAATATATLAAPGVGFAWRVTGFMASFSGAAVATPVRATITGLAGVTIGVGVGTNAPVCVSFVNPLDGANDGAVALALPSGGAGAVGDVVLCGFKVPTLPAYVGP